MSIYNHGMSNGLGRAQSEAAVLTFTDTYVETVRSYVGNEDALLFEVTAETSSGLLRDFLEAVEAKESAGKQLHKFTDVVDGERAFVKSKKTKLEAVDGDLAARRRRAAVRSVVVVAALVEAVVAGRVAYPCEGREARRRGGAGRVVAVRGARRRENGDGVRGRGPRPPALPRPRRVRGRADGEAREGRPPPRRGAAEHGRDARVVAAQGRRLRAGVELRPPGAQRAPRVGVGVARRGGRRRVGLVEEEAQLLERRAPGRRRRAGRIHAATHKMLGRELLHGCGRR